MTSLRAPYLPAIDGLRAFAVAAVLLFHANHLSGGFLGVDAFFVVSGFLITRQMLVEVERSGRISLRAFWARRARRLLPTLVLLLVVLIVVAYEFGYASERFTVRDDAPWALFFSLNWHHIAGSADYWTSMSSPSPLTHLWSLAVEEQFYLLWPLATVALVWRRASVGRATSRERSVLGGALVGSIASFLLMAAVFDPADTTRAYEGTDTRLGALLIGAMCATVPVGAVADRLAARLGRAREVLMLTCAAVLAWMWLRVDGRDAWLYRGGFLLHALLVATILIGVSIPSTWSPFQRLLAFRPVRWFGHLSYGLYLWHWPIYVALGPERVQLSRWPLTALRIAVTVVVATASYYLVEQPLRQGLQRRPISRTAILSIGGIAVAALAIAVVPLPEARPAAINLASLTPVDAAPATTAASAGPPTTPSATTDRPSTDTTVVVSTTPDATADTSGTADTTITSGPDPTSASTPPSATTATTATSAPTSTTAPITREPLQRVLWLGDSIAFTTSPGVAAAFGAVGIELFDGSFPGVGMLNDAGPAFFAQTEERILTQRPDLVIFQMSTWDEPYGADAIHAGLLRLRDLARSVEAELLLLPVPPLRDDQDDDGFRNDAAAARRLADEDPQHVSYLPTSTLWGDEFEYDLDGDKVPERLGDGVHLCPSGSAKFAIWLIQQLQGRYSNLSVADPSTWAIGGWTLDDRYARVVGGCALLP